jgi:hypothetical protein
MRATTAIDAVQHSIPASVQVLLLFRSSIPRFNRTCGPRPMKKQAPTAPLTDNPVQENMYPTYQRRNRAAAGSRVPARQRGAESSPIRLVRTAAS